MPLSEHEQRVLEQMEQALHAEDPRLASQLNRPAPSGAAAGLDPRRLTLGVLVAVAGLALVVVGVMSSLIWVGGIGFLAMVLGGAWAATPPRTGGKATLRVVGQEGTGTKRQQQPRKQRKTGSGNFMERMEQQWDRRREQGH